MTLIIKVTILLLAKSYPRACLPDSQSAFDVRSRSKKKNFRFLDADGTDPNPHPSALEHSGEGR